MGERSRFGAVGEEISLDERAKQQIEMNYVVRTILADFVDREVTPTLAAEAEGCVRRALDDLVRQGNYVLPAGLSLDRVELGADMKIKVFFKRSA